MPHPTSTLFPYTTLFRSLERYVHDSVVKAALPPGKDFVPGTDSSIMRSEEHTSELQSLTNLVCRLLLEKKKRKACGVDVFEHPSLAALVDHTLQLANAVG